VRLGLGAASSIWIFRALIDRTAGRILFARHASEHRAMLDEIWKCAEQRWDGLPPQSTLGASITVRLAALTAYAYEVLLTRDIPARDATKTVYDIAWAIYQKMGGAAWIASGILSRDTFLRLRIATVAFRVFPFSAPSYEWKVVESAVGVVAFDCLRCPVAEYFKQQALSELCVQSWCALDFELASTVWNARLERSGSIAGGARSCDFRWHAETTWRRVDAMPVLESSSRGSEATA
jgi:ubiquinone biosynthesis protein